MLHIYINQDTTTIIWETDSNKYRLVSCYMPYEEEEVPSQLIKELLRDSEASIIAWQYLDINPIHTAHNGVARISTKGVSGS